MVNNKQLSKLPISIPDHKDTLKIIREELNDIDIALHELKHNNTLNNDIYNYLNNQIIAILYRIGKLSLSIYHIKNDIECYYCPKISNHEYRINISNKEFRKSRMVWYNHYLQLNKPYDQLKTKCYKQLKNLQLLKANKLKKVKTNKPKQTKKRINKTLSFIHNVQTL